jgi:hypothetical protein
MKGNAGRKNYESVCAIRTVSDSQLRTARSITVSRGHGVGSFAVYLETIQGERVQISTDMNFKAANELKERYLQRRFFLSDQLPKLNKA